MGRWSSRCHPYAALAVAYVRARPGTAATSKTFEGRDALSVDNGAHTADAY